MLLAVGACSFLDPLSQSGLSVILAPPDTALYVGAHLRARGLMVNSFGDEYPSTHFRYAGPDSSASVDIGGLVTGIAYGRARVVLTRSGLADTGWVSVVPAGELSIAASGMVHVVNTDGSGYQAVASYGNYSGGPSAWIPGGAGLLYQYADPMWQDSTSILAVDLAGSAPRLVAHGLNPRVSADGAWLYFQIVGDVWRVHLDGSGRERVTTSAPVSGVANPDPSPDGTQLAFSRAHWPSDGLAQVDVVTLASGAERTVAAMGMFPRWSPDGTRLAFWRWHSFGTLSEGEIVVVNADGTDAHTVSAPGRPYVEQAVDWSPDGRWLVARSYDIVDLIDVQTGLTLPLAFSSAFNLPSWRR
jgi:Tol biopolymer transport system component